MIETNGEKTLTVKLIKYRLKGVVKLIDWYDKIGYIEMTPVDFISLPKKEDLVNHLNDAGFGCQKIVGGYVDVWEVYEHNVEVLSELNDVTIGDIDKNEIQK